MIAYGKNVLKDIEPKKIRKVFVYENIKDQAIINYLKQNNLRYSLVTKSQLDKMVNANHQGIVMDIYDYNYYKLEDTFDEDFIIVLDHLEDTHNFGAIIRSAEAAGVKSIIIPKDRSVRVTDVVMKTSCGALDRVKIVMVNNIVDTLKKFQKANYFVYSSFMDGVDYQTLDFTGKKVLVIGNEGKGISQVVEKITDVRIGIPMKGQINSLNASVAAGILIFAMNR